MYTLGNVCVLLLFPLKVICSIKTSCEVFKNVGQDVVLMKNTTSGNNILSVTWGLLGSDAKTITPQIIYISIRTNGPVLFTDNANTAAVRYKGRVSWVGNLTAGHAWFKLTNLNLNDTSQYAASIREQGDREETLKGSIHLTVAVPPLFNPRPPQTMIIAEDQDLNLTCNTVGQPTPNVTWVHGHVVMSTGTGSATLRIPNIRRDQNWTYECQAWNNPNERPISAQTVVIVYFFSNVATPTNLLQNIGKDVVFMWNTTNGNGLLSVEWGLLDSSGSIKPQFIYISARTNRPVLQPDLDNTAIRYKGRVSWVGNLNAGHAWFKITNLTLQDTKTYAAEIRVQGESSSGKYSTNLIVAAAPTFPHFPTLPYLVEVIEGRDLVINCTANGPPRPTVQWFTSDDREITSASVTGTVTLTKTNVQRSHNGTTYKCVASNNPKCDPVSAEIIVVVHYPPQATLTPASITVVQGNVIILRCTSDGSPPPSISWTKADGVIKAGHAVAGGTLRIPDAIKTDAGKYICTAKNTYDSRQHTHNATSTVIVKYQPSILFDKLKNETLNETEFLKLTCDADGNPPPTIKWKTPTGSVHTGNVYNIPSVSRSHAGTYTCTAGNGIGTDAMASIQVTVQYKPFIDDSQSSSKFTSWNGNSIRLRCIATGLPAPQISWYKPTNQQITTGVNIVPGGSEVTVLTTADQGDYGQYKCRATNILGSDEHLINVTRLYSPRPVTITITEVEASSVTVGWTKPAADGGLNIIGYLLEVSTKPPVMTVNTHAVITGLKGDTQYTVNVFARNTVGYGVMSSKGTRTKKTGKPAIPVILAALLETTSSKLSVVLKWGEPDNNGDNIIRYSIYVKEVAREADWMKHDDVTNPNQLECRITKNIVYGKTYMFMVTAWNKYGESVKDEGSAKTVNTTATKATSASAIKASEEVSKSTLGVIIAALILSLGFHVLQFLYLRRRLGMRSRKESQSQRRKVPSKKDDTGESYENDCELEDRVTSSVRNASPARQPSQTGPQYETIPQVVANVNPIESSSSGNTSNYQGLNLLSNTSIQETRGPVYEPLRTKSVEPSMQHDDQHPYEPLNIRNPNTTYQSLQTSSKESDI